MLVTAKDRPALGSGSALPATLVAFEQGCPHRRRLESWYPSCNTVPEPIIELGSYRAMLGCLVVGMGIALLPKSVLTTFPSESA